MKASPRIPPVLWKVLSRFNHLMVSRYGAKSKAASRVLILTTIGRKSGRPRPTPLQYEQVENYFFVASARGKGADWYRNLLVCPLVEVRVGDRQFSTRAELITDPAQVADFLELRMRRHPRFMRVMLRLEGLPNGSTRGDLEKLAERLAIVRLPVVRKIQQV